MNDRRIAIALPDGFESLPTRRLVVPVIVNWFPQLTEEQTMANALAAVHGKPRPFKDPNLIDVEITVDPR
jgi:hypothetical protein